MKRYLLFFFLMLLLLAGISGGLYWSSAQVPDFYQEALREQAEPEVRQEEAKEFVQRSMRATLVTGIQRTTGQCLAGRRTAPKI